MAGPTKIIGLSTFAALLHLTGTAAAAGTDASSKLQACARLETVRQRFDLPGATAGIRLANGAIVEFALGHSVGDNVPIEPGAKLLSGSIGKTYVAAIAIDLHGRGILDLDAPLKNLMASEPWFEKLPNACCVTLRQLLNHSSGWPTHVEAAEFQAAISTRIRKCPECAFTPIEAIQFIVGARPLFPPGQGFSYSETNYLVAGLAIEKATGRPYNDLLKERILLPLKLKETVPADRNEIPELVSGRIQARDNYFGIDSNSTMKEGKLLYNPVFESTGGGLAASSGDLVRWGHSLYTGHALMTPYLHELFTSVESAPGRRYGLGVSIRGRGKEVSYGHTGAIPGYRSALHYFPARDETVAAQFNADAEHDEEIMAALESAAFDAAHKFQVSPYAYMGIRCAGNAQ
jgi:D-alanyl-D-alanine carboxypeptidase